ncbi:MAG: hypothetical protein M1440_09930, partial [Gammaproteobacteria bacterium]|nr:hypothetical protein [Gammaproteobacteria bacterium]
VLPGGAGFGFAGNVELLLDNTDMALVPTLTLTAYRHQKGAAGRWTAGTPSFPVALGLGLLGMSSFCSTTQAWR